MRKSALAAAAVLALGAAALAPRAAREPRLKRSAERLIPSYLREILRRLLARHAEHGRQESDELVRVVYVIGVIVGLWVQQQKARRSKWVCAHGGSIGVQRPELRARERERAEATEALRERGCHTTSLTRMQMLPASHYTPACRLLSRVHVTFPRWRKNAGSFGLRGACGFSGRTQRPGPHAPLAMLSHSRQSSSGYRTRGWRR
jgi:predicted RNA-binding protein YlxR (DUF448 family)